MRIDSVRQEYILFDNGSKITFDHTQDCCEVNYADFECLEPTAWGIDFDVDLVFEKVDESGFRFGNRGGMMFFIPCYSYQNGYYSSDIQIYYNDEMVINMDCEYVDIYNY